MSTSISTTTSTSTSEPSTPELGAEQVGSGGGSMAAVGHIRFDPTRGSRAVKWLGPLLTLLVVLGAWTVLSEVVLSPERQFLLPAPWEVIQSGFLDPAGREAIFSALWSTTRVALIGLVVAIVIGTAAAVVMSQASWAESSFYPYAVILQTIPILAMVPLVGFWFGYDLTARLIVCVLYTLFPIITNTLFGIRSVEPAMHDQFSLFRATRWQRLIRLQLPAALPAALTGYRIAAGMAMVGSIIADFFFRQGRPGIGRLIDTYRQSLDTDLMIAALVASSIVGVIIFLAFGALLRVVERQRTPRH